jgi:hypothetical protein
LYTKRAERKKVAYIRDFIKMNLQTKAEQMFIFRQDPVSGWTPVITANFMIAVLKTKLEDLVLLKNQVIWLLT